MSAPTRLWLELSHHAAFRIGGWAWVRRDAAGVSGTAGGERRVDLERAALAALTTALASLPAGAPVELFTRSPDILAIPRRIKAAQAGEPGPTDNLDLWAQAMTALAPSGRVVAAAGPDAAPAGFAAAWAEFARDRAKDKGPFSAAIPKGNLAKAGA